MPDPTKQNWSRCEQPALSGSAFLNGFSGWLALDVIPALEECLASLRLIEVASLPEVVQIRTDLTSVVNELRALEGILRGYDPGVGDWVQIEAMAVDAIESCRSAQALVLRADLALRARSPLDETDA